MRLTLHTDYALRVLIYLAAHDRRSCAIAEIAAAYRISRHHLTKVVNLLANRGYVATMRGRGGGVRLARTPDQIVIGAVVRDTEEGLDGLADCANCMVAPACGLTAMLASGVRAMLAVFDGQTLADAVPRPKKTEALLARSRR